MLLLCTLAIRLPLHAVRHAYPMPGFTATLLQKYSVLATTFAQWIEFPAPVGRLSHNCEKTAARIPTCANRTHLSKLRLAAATGAFDANTAELPFLKGWHGVCSYFARRR